jgi:hypothetical protein
MRSSNVFELPRTVLCAIGCGFFALQLATAARPSRSDLVPQPRAAPGVVADLHALLQAHVVIEGGYRSWSVVGANAVVRPHILLHEIAPGCTRIRGGGLE